MRRFAERDTEQPDVWQEPDIDPASMEAPQETRVLICGDQPLYRAALSSLIDRHEGFRTIAESGNDPAEVERALASDVQMVLIDFDLAPGSGHDLETLHGLLAAASPRPTLVVSSGLDPDACQAALRQGISGVVLKTSGGDVLLDAMESAKRGQVWLDRPLLTQMFADTTHTRRIACGEQDKINQLTKREREIVRVACTGVTNKQIAEKLHISEATVRHHLGSIFAKLGVSTRSELVVYGYRHKLTDSILPR